MERSGAIMSCIIVARNYNSYMSVNFFSRYATYSSGRKGPQTDSKRATGSFMQPYFQIFSSSQRLMAVSLPERTAASTSRSFCISSRYCAP